MAKPKKPSKKTIEAHGALWSLINQAEHEASRYSTPLVGRIADEAAGFSQAALWSFCVLVLQYRSAWNKDETAAKWLRARQLPERLPYEVH